MATLCRTEFLATEDLVVYFGQHLQPVVNTGTGEVTYGSLFITATYRIFRPDGTIYDTDTVLISGEVFKVTVPVADYVQGNWIVRLKQEGGGNIIADLDYVVASWGVENTALVQAFQAKQQATLARKMQTNRIISNSSSAPTGIDIYDDDNTTLLGTQTIANADGTPVAPGQVLNIGKLT